MAEKQIQADKKTAQKYLNTALSFINAEEYGDAVKKLSETSNLSTLSDKAKKAISTAITYIKADEYNDAKKAINLALNAIN
jgi:outer membrane protein assembly factor BamD (BamD/ComL family)